MLIPLLVAGAAFALHGAQALSSMRDVLSSQETSAAADHTVTFVVGQAVEEGDTVSFRFDPSGQAFDLTAVGFADMDLEVDDDGTPGDCVFSATDDQPLAGSASGTDWGVSVDTGTDTVTLTAPSTAQTYADAGDCMRLKVGQNADGGTDRITNPSSPGSYQVLLTLTAASTETGALSVAIVNDEQVAVSAAVDQVLVFDLDTDTDGCADAANKSDTPQTVALGTLSRTAVTVSPVRICLDLDTNAQGGAVVQVAGDTAGLNSTATGHTVNGNTAAAETVNGGDEAFGVCVDSSLSVESGTIVRTAPYDGSPCDGASPQAGGIDTSTKEVFNTGGAPFDGGAEFTAELRVIAAVSNTTPATNDYDVQLTFTATGTF